MKLEQPFLGYFRISQNFGQNFNEWYKQDGNLGHTGIDFALPTGTPVISPCNGQVIYISTDISRGEGVTVLTDDIFQWNGQDCKFSCVMWHLKDKSIIVKVGDKVKTGDLLALSDNTGQSTGSHLHFSICPLSPDGSKNELALQNGYKGNIDPLPYLNLTLPPTAPIRVLKIGMSGDDVKNLQTILNKVGYNLVVDGKFGHLTQLAVESFQRKNNLVVDGKVGTNTNRVLNSL